MHDLVRSAGTMGTAGWEVTTLSGHATVRLSGEIDMAAVAASSPGLLLKLVEAVDGAGCVTCDLGEVGFIDSSGIHLLVKLRDRLAADGRALRVTQPNEHVRRIFEIVNASELFEIVPGGV
jgi:anti-anti-sigma factor